MNIDTLRTNTGYRRATYRDVMAAVDADHVTHLQRFDKAVAFRTLQHDTRGFPLGYEVTFNDCGGETVHRWHMNSEDKNRLARFVLHYLNGSYHDFEAGEDIEVYANQNYRPGHVLATTDVDVLIEYEMPNGTSALRLARPAGGKLLRERSVSHAALPKIWRDLIRQQGYSHLWIGNGQRGRVAL